MPIILAEQLVLETEIKTNQAVFIESERISRICDEVVLNEQERSAVVGHTQWLLPGFIDVHVHGSLGCDVMDASQESLQTIAKSLVKTGTTSFLATTMTVHQGKIEEALEVISAAKGKTKSQQAKVLGAHLEGPFINRQAKGAHLEAYIQDPTEVWLSHYLNVVALVTLAPEQANAMALIEWLKSKGIKVSLGHTKCSYDLACEAIDKGADSVTHLFNAMSGLNHREPGLVGAALLKPVYTELIADNVHVHPDLYELIYKLKGPDKMLLITDAMRGQCMKSGTYDLGGQAVVVTEEDARLEDGTLAGSVLTQHKALKHMLATKGIDMRLASKMLSTNPANLLERSDLGRIAEGCFADLVLLDESLAITSVWVNGEVAYSLPR